jgi:hypothetical protein
MKRVLLVMTAAIFAGALLMATAPARATDDESAAIYNSKCKMCHGATAEKKFDATKADDVLSEVILKGKTADKPPNMPGYEEKGINAAQAKALVAHMKSLKQ